MSNDSTHEARTRHGRRLRAPLAIAAILAMVVLAACGSSGSSSTSTKAAASTSSQKNRFAALQECLKKQGVTLPSRPSGNGAPNGGPAGGGAPPSGGGEGFKPPEGGSQSKLQEAIKKCGGGNFAGGSRPNSAASKAALTKYASCIRENGVNLPAPNTSGNGPVFNTKGINTSSSTFKNAQKACQSQLKGAFGPASGSGQAGPPNGAPPPGAEGSESG